MTDLTTGPSTARPSASPDAIVDRLFQRLAAMYGAKWLDLWAGVPMDAVKAEWSLRLTGHSLESIRLALEHLATSGTAWPPTLPEFTALVQQFRRRGPHVISITDQRRSAPPGGFQALRDVLKRTDSLT